MEATPPHVRHCIDLLRQSLMCQPDLTVEVKDNAVGGVRGFGTQHICADWQELVDWTREWQTWRFAGGGHEGDHKGDIKHD